MSGLMEPTADTVALSSVLGEPTTLSKQLIWRGLVMTVNDVVYCCTCGHPPQAGEIQACLKIGNDMALMLTMFQWVGSATHRLRSLWRRTADTVIVSPEYMRPAAAWFVKRDESIVVLH